MSESGPVRILCMEDDLETAHLFQETLERHGYQVDLAADGEKGLAMCEQVSYDVLVLDQNTPVHDGLEVIRMLADRGPLPPVILMTAPGDDNIAASAARVGEIKCIVKDADRGYLDLLPVVIEQVLSKDRSAQENRAPEEAPGEGEERYRTLVENSPVGVMSCDSDGNIAEANPAARRMLASLSRDDSQLDNLLTFLPFVEAKIADAVRTCLESGNSISGEFPYQTEQGEQIHTKLDVVPLRDAQGGITGAQAVVEDVSKRKKTEARRIRAERLKAMLDLAGGMVRNFGNSLRFVEACTQMAMTALGSKDLSEIKPLLEQIRDSNSRAVQIVRGIQRFALAGSAKERSPGLVFDLTDLVRKTVEAKELWCDKGVERDWSDMSVDAVLREGCRMEGEEDEIREVVVNLLKNAVEAVPSGGAITIKTFLEKDKVVLEVQDDGVGISKKNVEGIFDPFRTSKESHAGMGLAASLGIVRRHRGTILVTSQGRIGTTITVKVPRGDESFRKLEPARSKASDLSYRILLVGHDEANVGSIVKQLEEHGQTAFVAFSGQQAVSILKETELDVVVCSLKMRGMSGWDVASGVREVCEEIGVVKPVFIVVADADDGVTESDVHAHSEVDGLLRKPFDISGLLEMVAREGRTPGTYTDFSGRVRLDILDYVQIMLISGQQAILGIRSGEGFSGRLFVDKGRVRHAVCGDIEGEEAFYACMALKGGRFSTRPWREPERETITKGGELLLFEAAQKRDESRSSG